MPVVTVDGEAISIFSGAGDLDLGVDAASYAVRAAVELGNSVAPHLAEQVTARLLAS